MRLQRQVLMKVIELPTYMYRECITAEPTRDDLRMQNLVAMSTTAIFYRGLLIFLAIATAAAASLSAQSLDSICKEIGNAGSCSAKINLPIGAEVKKCKNKFFKVCCKVVRIVLGHAPDKLCPSRSTHARPKLRSVFLARYGNNQGASVTRTFVFQVCPLYRRK
jgi:hypothetical protein